MLFDSPCSSEQLAKMKKNETITIAINSLKDSMRRRSSNFSNSGLLTGALNLGQLKSSLPTPSIDGLVPLSRRNSNSSQYYLNERRPSILPFLNSTNSIKIFVNGDEQDESNTLSSSPSNDDTDNDMYSNVQDDYCYVDSAKKQELSHIDIVKARYEQAMIAMGNHQQQQRLLQEQLQKQEAEKYGKRGSISSRRYSYCFQPKYLMPEANGFFMKKKKNSIANCKHDQEDQLFDDEGESSAKIPVVKNASRDLKFSNILSDDGQCAILKTYEDEMYKQIKSRLPKKSIPRISTPIFNMKLNKKQQNRSHSNNNNHHTHHAQTSSFSSSTLSPSPSSSTSSISSLPSSTPSSASNSNHNSSSKLNAFLKSTPITKMSISRSTNGHSSRDVNDEVLNAQKTIEINKQIKSAMQILDDLAKCDQKPKAEKKTTTSSTLQAELEPRGSLVNNKLSSRRQSRRLSITSYNGKLGTTKNDNNMNHKEGNRKSSDNSSDDLYTIVKRYETWHSNWCKMFNNLF